MEVAPLSPALGAEVLGIDASCRPSAEQAGELRAALDEHGLLLFRGQQLDDAQHQAFVSTFGALNDLDVDDVGKPKTGYVSNSRDDGILGSGRILFHTDISCSPWPQPGTSLYAVEIPPGGTSTWFANAVRAMATLPDDLRARIDGREARHAGFIFNQTYLVPARVEHPGPYAPRSVHPMVVAHPRTGAEILFVSDLFAEAVEGMEPHESCDLLEALCAHIAKPEHTYEHHWEVGDLLVWDNYALQHARGEQRGTPRTLRRLGYGDMEHFLRPRDAQPMRQWMAVHTVLTAAREVLDELPGDAAVDDEHVAALAGAFAYYDTVRVRDS